MEKTAKPEYLVPDSKDSKDHFEEFGHYIRGVQYWAYEVKTTKAGTTYNPVKISNFVGKSLFHLDNGTNNSNRIIKIQRNTGEIHIIEIASSEMKLEAFETILKSKQCSFLGNSNQLKQVFIHWMDYETQAIVIETLGYNAVHDVYAFANAVYTSTGKVLNIDDVGIVHNPEDTTQKFYLPAFGLANRNNTDYEGERKFVYIEGELNFEAWAKLYFEAFENNGAIALLFLILSVFWDIVFSQVGFFPFLFLFGAFGTGKTTLVEFLLRLFGNDFIGTPLNNATQVALSRTIASRNNSIFYLKEYTKDTDEANQDLFLTAYDGSGRATGIKSNDNKTKIAQVKSAIMLDGNELPTAKNAVLSRMILLNFEKNQFSDVQKLAFNKLKLNEEKGFGKVLSEILQHREYFQQNFKRIYNENRKQLRNEKTDDFAERTLNHVALLLTPAKLLEDKLKLPFSYSEITATVIDNAAEQNLLLKETNEVATFWQSFAWNIKNANLMEFDKVMNNRKLSHYHVKQVNLGESILQIKIPAIYPEYVRYCKNNSIHFLDSNSLRMLLTSGAYKSFIPNSQKGRGGAYTDKYFGSCHQFLLEDNEGLLSISDVEINM